MNVGYLASTWATQHVFCEQNGKKSSKSEKKDKKISLFQQTGQLLDQSTARRLPSVESNFTAHLQKVQPPWPCEISTALSVMSEQVWIKSDTNLTGVHCAAIATDGSYAGLADLERAFLDLSEWERHRCY